MRIGDHTAGTRAPSAVSDWGCCDCGGNGCSPCVLRGIAAQSERRHVLQAPIDGVGGEAAGHGEGDVAVDGGVP